MAGLSCCPPILTNSTFTVSPQRQHISNGKNKKFGKRRFCGGGYLHHPGLCTITQMQIQVMFCINLKIVQDSTPYQLPGNNICFSSLHPRPGVGRLVLVQVELGGETAWRPAFNTGRPTNGGARILRALKFPFSKPNLT